MRARDIMTTRVVTVRLETSVQHAVELLADRGFTALPVVNESGELIGMVSEVDVLTSRFPHDPRYRHPHPTSPPGAVGEVMAGPAVTADAGTEIGELVEQMWRHRHRCLPVVSGGRLVGIVTRRDLTRVLARGDAAIAADDIKGME